LEAYELEESHGKDFGSKHVRTQISTIEVLTSGLKEYWLVLLSRRMNLQKHNNTVL